MRNCWRILISLCDSAVWCSGSSSLVDSILIGPEMTDTVERKIMFYRIHPRPYADGTIPVIDIGVLLSEIKKLNFDKKSTGPKSRYCAIDDRLLCAWPTVADNKERIQLGTVRRIDLPSIDDGGNVKPLPIADDEGLLEVSHIQFFPHGIVGAEFNFYGPRATAISTYCEEKTPTLPQFRLRPLFRNDAQGRLNELDEIRLVDIRVHKSEVANLGAFGSGLPGGFTRIADEMDGDSFEIVLRSERGKSFSQKMRNAIVSLFSSSKPLNDRFESLKVSGPSCITGNVTELNLLQDQFIQAKHIAKMHGKTRAVSESKMYTAIEESYNSMKTELALASSMEVIQ